MKHLEMLVAAGVLLAAAVAVPVKAHEAYDEAPREKAGCASMLANSASDLLEAHDKQTKADRERMMRLMDLNSASELTNDERKESCLDHTNHRTKEAAMKCLFVRAPYAGYIVDGVKKIEYRTRATKIRGKIGIIQSKSGTVIGEVEISDCRWNEKLEYYEWLLTNPARYAKPVPYRHKNGAVVWIEADYDPKKQRHAPKLSPSELKRQRKEYLDSIYDFLHPISPEDIANYVVAMKDGRELSFETEEETKAFYTAHKKEVEEIYIVLKNKE